MKEFTDTINSFEIIKSDEWPEYDIKITLKPCFKCNHKCWFCSEYDNTTKMWTKEQCDIVLDKLKEIPDNKKKIFIYFYGGEPTLSKYWEYLNYELVEIFNNKNLFLQTHTNLSVNKNRLENFLKKINKIKSSNHIINICNSYHIGKQKVEDYAEKMYICEKYNSLGFCFFSTELPKKEIMLNELTYLTKKFPEKIKMKFTEIDNLKDRNINGYENYKNNSYLMGKDNGKSLEYRYWLKNYPHLRQYFEKGWNFKINNKKQINYSDVKGNNIHKKFKFMKCESGLKNLVIDYNLNVYKCNDYNYKNIKPIYINDLNFETYHLKCERCILNACYDGLDFKKIR